jgi:hypothetical protein
MPPVDVNAFPFASFNVTVNALVALPSAVRLDGLADTALVEAAAAPGTVWIDADVPVRLLASVAVTVPDATTDGVENVTVASPLESVMDVAVVNAPPAKSVDQVTLSPAVGTATSDESVSCAVTVMDAPATGPADDAATTYFAAGPCGVTAAASDATPAPIPFTALRATEYVVPFVSPTIVNGDDVVGGEHALHDPPPSRVYW